MINGNGNGMTIEHLIEEINPSILLVDDESMVLDMLAKMLNNIGFEKVHTAQSSSEVYSILEKTTPALTFMDINLNGENGFDIIDEGRKKYKISFDFVVMSGNDEKEQFNQGILHSTLYFLKKPFESDALRYCLTNVFGRLQDRIEATIDPLTQVPNRKTFLQALTGEIERVVRYSEQFALQTGSSPLEYKNNLYLSLLMMDIDHFKKFNDEYGHLEGDYVLKKLSAYYTNHLRRGDIFARYGGEEFISMLPETRFNEAHSIYNRLLWDFSEEKMQTGEMITCSGGLATITPDFLNAHPIFQEILESKRKEEEEKKGLYEELSIDLEQKLIKSADQGLYKAKNHRRGHIYPRNALIEFGYEN